MSKRRKEVMELSRGSRTAIFLFVYFSLSLIASAGTAPIILSSEPQSPDLVPRSDRVPGLRV